ncbi:hypothetical protein GCM10023189_10030 [Nibrella saemangeumensis]|uniref:TonB C-terminal domain-containing protein n=1 Tax=Nibrella saemangeumensis TaxID=1084526 RepID=A0ABP8MJX2_9BACT
MNSPCKSLLRFLLPATFCLMSICFQTFAQLAHHVEKDKLSSSLEMPAEPASVQAPQPLTDYAPNTNAPFFPGGQQALQRYLKQLDLYPRQARMSQREGTVLVQCRVMATGELCEVRVVRSAGTLLDQAAIQAVEQMPRWYPAHRAGSAVASLMILPITFRVD